MKKIILLWASVLWLSTTLQAQLYQNLVPCATNPNNGSVWDPSEQELEENGLNLGEMHKMQMVKIEELTLYLIEQQKQIETLKAEIEALKKQK